MYLNFCNPDYYIDLLLCIICCRHLFKCCTNVPGWDSTEEPARLLGSCAEYLYWNRSLPCPDPWPTWASREGNQACYLKSHSHAELTKNFIMALCATCKHRQYLLASRTDTKISMYLQYKAVKRWHGVMCFQQAKVPSTTFSSGAIIIVILCACIWPDISKLFLYPTACYWCLNVKDSQT